MSIGGRVFNNDTPSNSGAMSLHQALVVSCDTVFYELAYEIWLKDHRNADTVTSPHARVQEMQKMELAWGFGRDTGIDLPEESTGTVPTRAWLYDFYRQYKSFWCKNGRAGGTYLQQIEYDDCQSGNVWTPGQAVNAAIGQGYVTVTPLQLARAYAALANGGTLYSPRIGEALISPAGHVVRRITPPVAGHLQGRACRRHQPGHRSSRIRRLPARQTADRGQDRYGPGGGQGGHLGLRLLRPGAAPEVRGGRDGPGLRLRRRLLGPRGAPDLGRDLRA